MSTFCFLPARRALLAFCLSRMILAKIAITWIFVTSPRTLLLGPVGHFILNFLPGSTNLSLVIPALTTEIVVDTVLLAGVHRNTLLCILPWLVINIMIVLGLGAAVMALLSSVILLPVSLDSETGSDMAAAFQDIKSLLIVIIFNMFLILQMVNVSAVVQIFVEMKENVVDTVDMNEEAVGIMDVEDNDSSSDLLRNEERPFGYEDDQTLNKSKTQASYQDVNDSFDSFLYEDVP
eukprot:GFUD01009309.1.p1 GENE.GFUD01009309.1~~GFUD01009309.1.p1  ORF type:complete len:235 (+),score=85.20 GFUD01009309.1:40-744(+)